jgi:hypothetical protein
MVARDPRGFGRKCRQVNAPPFLTLKVDLMNKSITLFRHVVLLLPSLVVRGS